MTEHPILFTRPMVRVILDGQKTQTRRVIQFPLNLVHSSYENQERLLGDWPLSDILTFANGILEFEFQTDVDDSMFGTVKCPYGSPGDLLWVRETVRAEETCDGLDVVRYISDDSFRPIDNTSEAASDWLNLYSYRSGRGLVVPSIHMPRWASRLTLRVTYVRVERVQDISVEDAFAEGALCADIDYVGDMTFDMSKIAFGLLWDSINAKRGYSWNSNPWVWAVSFERVE